MNMRHALAALVAMNARLLLAVSAQLHPAFAADSPEVVRARAFELVDERGQVRAQFNVESSGETVLRLRDASGEIRVKLGADKDGSGLLLLDGATEPGIHMLAGANGASVTLSSRGRTPRVIAP